MWSCAEREIERLLLTNQDRFVTQSQLGPASRALHTECAVNTHTSLNLPTKLLFHSTDRPDDLVPMLPVLVAFLPSSLALLSQFRLEYNVNSATALAALTTPPKNADDNSCWVAVFPNNLGISPDVLQTPTQNPLVSPTAVGAPTAVGRLRYDAMRLDSLACTLPKEDPLAAELIGLTVDALLQEWLQHCLASPCKASFEDLLACPSTFTTPILTARGFATIESPDFAALAAGESIATHCARLPAAILSYDRRAGSCTDVLDCSLMETILTLLREQPEPGIVTEDATSAQSKQATDDDPWAGMKAMAGF